MENIVAFMTAPNRQEVRKTTATNKHTLRVHYHWGCLRRRSESVLCCVVQKLFTKLNDTKRREIVYLAPTTTTTEMCCARRSVFCFSIWITFQNEVMHPAQCMHSFWEWLGLLYDKVFFSKSNKIYAKPRCVYCNVATRTRWNCISFGCHKSSF